MRQLSVLNAVMVCMLVMKPANLCAYPTRLLHMKFTRGAYQKNIFLIGDVHCIARENSRNGNLATKNCDLFFSRLLQSARSWSSLPLLWELSVGLLKSHSPKFYMHRKAIDILREIRGRQDTMMIPCDQLRNKNSYLKRFMLDTLYRPSLARRRLETTQNRLTLIRSISRTLIPAQGNILEKNLTAAKKRPGLPEQIVRPLSENLTWYRNKVSHIIEDLRYSPQDIVASAFSTEYKSTLTQTTADLEILTTIFLRPEQAIFVYVGDAHVRRLKTFLFSAGFRSSFEVEKPNFLSAEDFRYFLQQVESVKLNSRKNIALGGSRRTQSRRSSSLKS